MQWSSQNWSERLQTFNAPQVLLTNSRKRAAYKENLMREGVEGEGADRQKGQPEYPNSACDRSFSCLCPCGVRKRGGAALAIMGLKWTGGGARETFDKNTWSTCTV